MRLYFVKCLMCQIRFFKMVKENSKRCLLIVSENHFLWKANADFQRYQEFDQGLYLQR